MPISLFFVSIFAVPEGTNCRVRGEVKCYAEAGSPIVGMVFWTTAVFNFKVLAPPPWELLPG